MRCGKSIVLSPKALLRHYGISIFVKIMGDDKTYDKNNTRYGGKMLWKPQNIGTVDTRQSAKPLYGSSILPAASTETPRGLFYASSRSFINDIAMRKALMRLVIKVWCGVPWVSFCIAFSHLASADSKAWMLSSRSAVVSSITSSKLAKSPCGQRVPFASRLPLALFQNPSL